MRSASARTICSTVFPALTSSLLALTPFSRVERTIAALTKNAYEIVTPSMWSEIDHSLHALQQT